MVMSRQIVDKSTENNDYDDDDNDGDDYDCGDGDDNHSNSDELLEFCCF